MSIFENVKSLLLELPPGVTLVAAAKTRTPEEIDEAIRAGVQVIGENYVKEAEIARGSVKEKAQWHCIGHLQSNKVKKAVECFDLIETVDSFRLAKEIDRRCAEINKTMPVLIEVNSGREAQKAGVFPEQAAALICEIGGLRHIKVLGLMTMGPLSAVGDAARPYFDETKRTFDQIKAQNYSGVEMRYLSMGMSDTYRAAVAAGANLVRVGTRIFGERLRA